MRILRLCHSAPLLAALLLNPSTVMSGEAAVPGVHVGKSIEITRSHGWCWFPTVHKFNSGGIMVTAKLSPDETNLESATSAYCISRDGGLTWSDRHTMGQGALQDGAWTEVPDKDDSIWHWSCDAEPSRVGDYTKFTATLTKFSRGGRASCEDRDVTFTLSQPAHMAPNALFDYLFDGKTPVPDSNTRESCDGFPWGNIIRGADGQLYCSAYFSMEEDAKREEEEAKHSSNPLMFNRVYLLRSTDGGHSWSEYSTIARIGSGARPSWIGREGFNECSLAILPDGRLYAVYRTGGMLGNGWSSDEGRTWSLPAPIGFTGVAPRVHVLSDGTLAIATGRPDPVSLRLSRDGGKNWSKPVVLFTGKSTHYCDLVEIQPGKLLVVYDSTPYGWYEIPPANRDARNAIMGTFVDLSPK